jgi:hypothetical protein
MKTNPIVWAGSPPARNNRLSLAGLALLLYLLLPLLMGAGSAQIVPPDPPPAVPGGFNPIAVEGAIPDNAMSVVNPSAPAAGALIYEDFIALETKARGLLDKNRKFRESISPYQSNASFDLLVGKYDYQAGFSKVITDTATGYAGVNLQTAIDTAVAELLEARNLYAFLLVYAPQARFRADPAYNAVLCAKPEEPNPPAKDANGNPIAVVLPPVIDWCNFEARLLQSVREAANIRMIFAQQFVVDALGLHFSATTTGGEAFVKEEVAKLRVAQFQFERAEAEMTSAMHHNLGSGCYISDFYTQAEWAIFSRAAEGQENAQHHIAVRQSYLNIDPKAEDVTTVFKARDEAETTLRSASIDGYVKLIALGGLGADSAPGRICAQAKRPDGQQVAEMALSMAESRARAREFSENRNIFGFDVTFTPARPYATNPIDGKGLWQQAMDSAILARDWQRDEIDATRAFDATQEKLLASVEKIRTEINSQVAGMSGCSRSSFPDDASWAACVTGQMATLDACLLHVKSDGALPPAKSAFDTCMDQEVGGKPLILPSEAQRSLIELREVWLAEKGLMTQILNNATRIQLHKDRSATVKMWMGLAGGAQTAADIAVQIAESIEVTVGPAGGTTTKPGTAVAAIAIAAAGSMSTAADIEMEKAETTQEIENLLLDLTELRIELFAAEQQYRFKYSEYQGLMGDLGDALIEAERQRSYLALSPGNDPSFRIVRDSARLVLARRLEHAARISYLAARRAEYEFGIRLSANGFRMSDIYRARTAGDIIGFLTDLDTLVQTLRPGTDRAQVNISVAKHVLGWSDAVLAQEGFTTSETAEAERVRRFREWVAAHTVPNDFEAPKDGKPVLRFTFASSLLDDGLIADVLQQGVTRYYQHQIAPYNPQALQMGMGVDVTTDQSGVDKRTVAVTQSGMIHMRTQAGCIFNYRLVAPAEMLGLDWPKNQNPEAATVPFQANVNGAHQPTESGFRVDTFKGRSVSSTAWEILLFAGGTPDMDLQQLTDLVLRLDTTYASRSPGLPKASDCARIDF